MRPDLDGVERSRAPRDLLAFDRDPYTKTLAAEVLEVAEEGGRPYVILSDTVCFPEGGGQPADRGWLDGHPVVDVQRVGDEIRHYLEKPLEIGPARLELDWDRRFDLMQQHTAQHLLTAIALGRFGWPTTSFHLYEQVSDVELEVPRLTASDLEALEGEVAAEIRAARPIATGWVSPQTYGQMKVRSRRLPAGHTGDIRLVEIAGIDLNTCGGTHLRSTSELECLKLLATDSCRGGKGTRLHWVAGGRARRRLGEHELRATALRQLLGTRDDDLADVVRLKLDQLREVERQLKATRAKLARSLAKELRGTDTVLTEAHLEGLDLGFLQQLARLVVADGATGIIFLTADHQGDRSFVVAAGDSSPVDLVAAGKEVAEVLGARGGGRDKMFQGKAPSLKHRAAALERLQLWARSTGASSGVF